MKAQEALDDLAFMRALVQSGSDIQRPLGEGYVAAGLCYGVQMLLHVGQAFGLVGDKGALGLAIGLGPTVAFLVLVTWLSIRNRASQSKGSMVARTVASVFAAFGIANFALIAIVGSQAARLHSLEIWLIYPCVVLALQGAAWMIVYALRRRAWMLAVSLGWYVTGVSMALCIGHTLPFLLVGAFGFWALMVGPGIYMMRRSADA